MYWDGLIGAIGMAPRADEIAFSEATITAIFKTAAHWTPGAHKNHSILQGRDMPIFYPKKYIEYLSR